MFDLIITVSAALTVALIFIPLVGAQRKSLVCHEALVKQAFIAKSMTEDKDKQREIDNLVKVSRSWLFSLAFMVMAPFVAFKSGISFKKANCKERTEEDDALLQAFAGSLFFSNPITMTVAALLALIALGVGSLILFSVISFMAITANDNQKLASANFCKPRYVISQNFSQVYNVFKTMSFKQIKHV
ncbi:hypothetical protein [Vibrio cholerae]|uniref:hypothetical protein n=1 Tax=Vibrio cholerae TaxID=666 RepID=UPI00226E3786|nr:hypothetical protein [Vibrio cholerae]EGR4177176.1 hypothetical protein [Vibrio cholerae]EIC2299033.1 hypothetical protein [Vibrio cholerae]EJL6912615.1 hypothetical protein [Vibrio cholerae]EJR3664127.1 hypothetical protein [Vibrio cholerae]EKF9179370.1 hypothetical protein [Vibrio cholerae]